MEPRKALWNKQQNELRNMLVKPNRFEDAINLCLQQHAMIHSSEISQNITGTFEDELWEGLDEATFRIMLTPKDETIAWALWHITRIEDITMNVLVACETEVIDMSNWITKLNTTVRDTGNAMTSAEIVDFSSGINMQELRNYRKAVGHKTRDIIKAFEPADLKRKMEQGRLQRILDEGSVLNVDGAKWLVDFWGRKTVAGILLMPVTRHPLVHINEALRIKERFKKKPKGKE